MKTIITTIILAFISYTASAQNVKITINNVNQKGQLMVGLCTSQKDFDTDNFLVGQKFRVDENTGTITAYFNVPNGVYGVSIYLDVNNNHEFDFGIDKYGFSNHYQPMGPPNFESFKFTLNGSYQETIGLQ